MNVYLYLFALFLLLCALDFFEKNALKIYGLCISYFILLFFVGFRDETGTDWTHYWDHYNKILMSIENDYKFDWGYEYGSILIAHLGVNYNIFLFLYTSIYLYLFYYSFSKLIRPNLAVLIFYSVYLIAYMGTSRQFMAMALIFYSLSVLSDGKFKNHYIYIFIATLFHKTAAVVILSKFIVKKLADKSNFYILFSIFKYMLLAAVFTFILVEVVVEYLVAFPLLLEKAQAYIISEDNIPIFYQENDIDRLKLYGLRIFFLIMFFLLINLSKPSAILKNSFNLYLIGSIIFIVFYGAVPAAAIRLSVYFQILEIVLVSSLRFKIKFLNIFFILYIIYSGLKLQTILNGPDSIYLIPYKNYF
jgi:hypothetical protein